MNQTARRLVLAVVAAVLLPACSRAGAETACLLYTSPSPRDS